MKQFFNLSQLDYSSRPAGDSLMREHAGQSILDWEGFCRELAALRTWLAGRTEALWIVHTLDTHWFLVAVLALLQSGRQVIVPGSLQPGLIAAVRADLGGLDAPVLSDEEFPGAIDLRRFAAPGGEAAAPAAWPRIDPARAMVTLYTSGSTGQPKAVPKRLEQIEAEVANLSRQWGPSLRDATVWSTVSHQHFYGMLFQAFLPLCAGLAIGSERISYPETFMDLAEPAVGVVCSPAFFKRLAETGGLGPHFKKPPVLFSSGGVLPPETAQAVRDLTDAPVIEIYGSTETGGIGWRMAPGSRGWQGFAGNEVRIASDGVIEFRSPYLPDASFYRTGDKGRIDADGAFVLDGRVDTIVKIEEKRIALNEVENRLKESPLVADAAVLALEHGRQFLAAVVVPSALGRQRFATLSKHDRTQNLRDWLHQWFEATVLPRKWRFVDSLPLNTQGKRDRLALEALFAPVPGDAAGGAAASSKPTEPEVLSVETSPNRVVLSLKFSPDCIWFDGHFPDFPILPGVVQIDWLMTCAERWLGVSLPLKRLPRLKFQKPIRPHMAIILELDWDPSKAQLSFRYIQKKTGEPLSSGKLNLEHNP